MQWFKLFFYILVIILLYIIFFTLFGKMLSTFSFAFAYIFIYLLEYFLFLPLNLIKKITKERINFNIKTSGLKFVNYEKIIKLRILFVSVIFILAILLALKSYFIPFIEYLEGIFQNTQAFITIDYPTYKAHNSFVTTLSKEKQNINLDSTAYIKIKLNQSSSSLWKLILQDKREGYTRQYIMPNDLNSSINFSSNTLYESFHSHCVNLTLTNGKTSFFASLNIKPVLSPSVKLSQTPVKFKYNQNTSGKLAFSVYAISDLSLTRVTLNIRTQSGFKYEQSLAEFMGNKETNFTLPYTEVIMSGIPFKENDILYIKAVAQTPIVNQYGESNELQFAIKDPIQIRNEIIKNLESAIAELNNEKKFESKEIDKIQDFLLKAIQLASNINQNGFMVRKIGEISTNVNKIEKKQDDFYKISETKLAYLLETLKKQIQQKEAKDLIYFIQIFKQKLFSNNISKDSFKQLRLEAVDLKNSTYNILEKLNNTAKVLKPYLSEKETKKISEYLMQDITAQMLEKSADSLEKSNLAEAGNNANSAYDSAQKNIVSAIHIIEMANKKLIYEAKKELDSAQTNLENSKRSIKNNEIKEQIQNTQNALSKIPKINNEFNEYLQEAKKDTKEISKNLLDNNIKKRFTSTQFAQDNIEKALLSLDEEEKSEKEIQQEQDIRNLRSYSETIATQGLLDQSWRKKILDDITRLKKETNQNNAQMIEYLESRLR